MEKRISKDMLPFKKDKFLSTDNIDAYYYPEVAMIHFIWKKQTSGEALRKAFEIGLEFSKLNPTHYFLSDIRKQGVVSPEDRRWVERYTIPAAVQQGGSKVGIIFEGSVVKMYYLNMISLSLGKQGIPIKYFKATQDAFSWLIKD